MNLRLRIAAFAAATLTTWGAAIAAPNAPASTPASEEAGPSKVTKPPKLVHFVQAPYPESELANGQKASVVLDVEIGADGNVAGATVAQSAGPAFDAAALAAVQGFVFEPAEINGVPSPVRVQYRYDFSPTAATPKAPKTTADFTGVVRNRKTGAPLAGVIVGLDERTAATDANGRFSFEDATPGSHQVTLSGSGFTPVGTEETLVAGHKYDATYDVEEQTEELPPEQRVDFELVVVDTQLEKSIASTTVSAEQGARVAGTGGDVIKVVENLPGVARSSVGSGALVVWGAAATDTRIYVDDVHIPVLYHEGGYRSVIHSDLVKNVELQPGGYGAPYGRGLGGLVTVGMKPLEADGYHGSASIDAIDAAASVRGSIGDKVRFQAAVRRSHLDWVLQRVSNEDVGEFVPIPKYWDSQVRLAWVPRDGESVEVGTLLSSDQISQTLVGADPNDTKVENKTTNFQRVYARYERHLDDGSTITATPFFGFDHTAISNQFGTIPATLSEDATLFGLRAVWTGNPVHFLLLSTGIDAEVQRTSLSRFGSVNEPPREGDERVFGQAPINAVNQDTWQTTVAGLAPFVQGDIGLADGKVHVIPGARLEPSVVTTSRRLPTPPNIPSTGVAREDTQVEPRLAVRWDATSRITLHGALGIYHQEPLPEDLSAQFGNPLLQPSKAVHYVLGAAFHLSKPVTIEMTGFYAKQTGLATRNQSPTPEAGLSLVQDGLGRAYGTQFLLRHELVGKFFGWISYSILRSERTDGAGTDYRPFDFDQTHVFTALASYDLGKGFEVGARFRYSTGYPRTPVASVTYDNATDTYQPVFGAHNSIRIPAFYQGDVRLSKQFKFGENTSLEVYLDVQNVTNHKNPEEIIYNNNYSQKAYITGLPLLPVAGAKLVW